MVTILIWSLIGLITAQFLYNIAVYKRQNLLEEQVKTLKQNNTAIELEIRGNEDDIRMIKEHLRKVNKYGIQFKK